MAGARDVQRDIPQSALNTGKESHVVLRSNVLIIRIGCRELELGWNSLSCDSEFLDPAFKWDSIIDDPLGDGTYRPGVLIDQMHCGVHEQEREV